MDLDDILQKRTDDDLRIAKARALEIALEIDTAAAELMALRNRLSELERQRGVKSVLQAVSEVAAQPSAPQDSETPFARVWTFFGGLSNRRGAGPRLRWHFDEFGGVAPARSKGKISVNIARHSAPVLAVSGWAVPGEGGVAYSKVRLMLVGASGRVYREVATHHRSDVAAHFGDSSFSACGFRIDIPMHDIAPGHYAVEIAGFSPDGSQGLARVGSAEFSA